jgi:hypothetical protein
MQVHDHGFARLFGGDAKPSDSIKEPLATATPQHVRRMLRAGTGCICCNRPPVQVRGTHLGVCFLGELLRPVLRFEQPIDALVRSAEEQVRVCRTSVSVARHRCVACCKRRVACRRLRVVRCTRRCA